MFVINIIGTLLLLLGAADANDKIVNGFPLSISSTPWQVSIVKNGRFLCGGSIISPIHVLSAAHCFINVTAEEHTVRSGSVSPQSGGIVSVVQEIISHPLFGTSVFADYDISVLRLAQRLQFNIYTKAVVLSGSKAVPGSIALVSGWGRLSFSGPMSDQLQGAFLQIIDRESCQNIFKEFITNRMICAYTEDKSTCKGDSGGPLITNTGQIGLVSHGKGCRAIGVFTNIPGLRDFIDEVTEYSARWS